MTLQYRKANLDDLEEIYSLISHAINEMTEHDILQWDQLYPAREDFLGDISQNSLYVGLADGHIAVVYTLNQAARFSALFKSRLCGLAKREVLSDGEVFLGKRSLVCIP